MKGLSGKISFRKLALGEPDEGTLSENFHLLLQECPASRRWKARRIWFRPKGPIESWVSAWKSSLPLVWRAIREITNSPKSAWGGGETPSSFSPGSAFVSRSPSSSFPLSEIDVPVAEIKSRDRGRHSSSPLPQIRVQPRWSGRVH